MVANLGRQKGANQYHIMWNTFTFWRTFYTYHETKSHYRNTFTTSSTDVRFRKHFNKTQNTYTNLQVAKQLYKTQPTGIGHLKFGFVPEVITEAGHFEFLMFLVNRDGERPSHFLVLFVVNTS